MNTDIKDKFIRNNRWHVRVQNGEGQKTLPQANYVWLKGNPSFKEIPTAYVIHHLDYDPLNDDISNLALMAKYHHVAHHWKNKNVETEVKVDDANKIGVPHIKPKLYYNAPRKCWRIIYRMHDESGKSITRTVNNDNGSPILTEQHALRVAMRLWPYFYD